MGEWAHVVVDMISEFQRVVVLIRLLRRQVGNNNERVDIITS